MKKHYSWSNPRPPQRTPETGASITVPNQTLTVRQIMDRYRRGMPLEGRIKQGEFHDGEFPDLTNLDLSEIAALKRAAKEQVDEMQRDLQMQEMQKQAAEKQQLNDQIQQLKKQLEAKERAEPV